MRVLNLKYFSQDSIIDQVIMHKRHDAIHIRIVIGGIYYSVFDGNNSYQAASVEQILADFKAFAVKQFIDIFGTTVNISDAKDIKDVKDSNHNHQNSAKACLPTQDPANKDSVTKINGETMAAKFDRALFDKDISTLAANNIKQLSDSSYAAYSFAI